MPKSTAGISRRPAGAGRTPSALGEIYAALDLGTNNCRLLIATQPVEHLGTPRLQVLDSFSRVVRLGEGIGTSGELSARAAGRTLTALGACKKKLDQHAVTKARFVATEACRRASNAREFLDRVAQEVGIHIDIITNEEEARLAFKGCASLLCNTPHHALAFDIGGGSTEFMWVQMEEAEQRSPFILPHRIRAWHSLPCGVMNLSEKFGGMAYAEAYYDEMVAYLIDELCHFDRANHISDQLPGNGVQLLSTSGTVTTLAAIHLGLKRYERARVDGVEMRVSDLRRACRTILGMRPSERFANSCIGADRSDFIISGCAIFEAITDLWPIETIRIADRGVREGIILSLIEAQHGYH